MITIHNEKKDKEFINSLIANMLFIWKRIFKCAIHTDFEKPMTGAELENPENEIESELERLQRELTFIYETLNTATRNNDIKKITTLGPMACALKYIVGYAEYNR